MKTIEVIDRFNIPHLIPIKKIDHVYTYEERDGELIKEHTMIVTASKYTIDTYIPYYKFKDISDISGKFLFSIISEI